MNTDFVGQNDQVIEDRSSETHRLCDPKEISKWNPKYDEGMFTRITKYWRAAYKDNGLKNWVFIHKVLACIPSHDDVSSETGPGLGYKEN